jgi:hypothetical protein
VLESAAAAGAAAAHPASPAALLAAARALFVLAASAPGAAGALRAAPGGPAALRDAVRALCAAAAAAPPAERAPLGAFVDLAAGGVARTLARDVRAPFVQLLLASGAAGELALHLAAQYRAAAAAGAARRDVWAESGFGAGFGPYGCRPLEFVLNSCWSATGGGAPLSAAGPLFEVHEAAVSNADIDRMVAQ